jgi:DNA invertase Pin-like site-specific DNA recombinase
LVPGHPMRSQQDSRLLPSPEAACSAFTRLDRLARSTRDLLNVLDAVKQAGAGLRSLKDTWADTTTPHGQLMLTILGGLAECERTLIRARTGRERAKARGVRFG